MKKLIVIIHEPVADNASPSAKDVKDEVEAVARALNKKGYETKKVVFDNKNAGKTIEYIKSLSPLLVFNLVETIDNSSALCYTVAEKLEENKIIYSGCSAKTIFETTNKIRTKEILKKYKIDVAKHFEKNGEGAFVFNQKYIIKPISEEGSEGITSKSIVRAKTRLELRKKIEKHSKKTGFECFAERFLNGTEYCVSLVGFQKDIKIFPPARMDFCSPDGKKHCEILDYDSKWKPDSFVYKSSNRSFDVLLKVQKELIKITRRCLKALDLSGYARLDLRCDENGKIYIIDVNANPCLTEDAGFAAAAKQAGLKYEDLIEKIVQCALAKKTFQSD